MNEINSPAEQPDGIEFDSPDLPKPERAARRVKAYIERAGDGMYDVIDRRPLYGRDLEALAREALRVGALAAEIEQLQADLAKAATR